jgi:4-alpha-glucanotransferase
MTVGIVHDLPVGVHPGGADTWAVRDVFAADVRVGAPPDAFNQQGQDWGLPPWRPDRLDATGYAPYREMISAVLRRGHGIRIDHVAGLFRLWWIPPDAGAAGGTYVRYDAAAMVGILAVEAHRHRALVVGEDLGTVEPEVTEALSDQHMLGCQVLWFARDKGEGSPLRPPARWPPETAASIATHDLPTAAGFLTGEQVTVRDRLGLLTRPVAAERAQAAAERAELLDLLRAEGLLTAAEPTETEAILAMHALLARTPCRLLLASPYDVLADRRQPNLPGTVDEYPNWRLPLPATLDALLTDPRTAEVARLLRRR